MPPIKIIADFVHQNTTFPLERPVLSPPHWSVRRVAKGDCDTFVSRSLRRSAVEGQRLCARCLESKGAIQASPHVLSLFWGLSTLPTAAGGVQNSVQQVT